MDNRTIFGYVVLIWLSIGTLIWIITVPKLFKKSEYRYWWTWAELFHSYMFIAPSSIIWIILNIYWHYEHKNTLKKIKEGKTRASDLF